MSIEQSLMFTQSLKKHAFLPAALMILIAATFAFAQQQSDHKQNARPENSSSTAPTSSDSKTSYSYEFTQPEFLTKRIFIEHDQSGRGRITFEKKNDEAPIVESLALSSAALARIAALWESLRFLESTEDYQTARQYPHLGTMRLTMVQASRKRTAEFNWSSNKDASSLANEYRRIGDQAMWVFDIAVARESQPLNAPKLMEQFEVMLKRNGLSDPAQLIPLLKEISTDEYLPLIARNHALRLLKKLEK
ncbi:MAG TPA: hypothetical protein VJU86_16065 [Pyrinomonadaceae bacterium]|nr:hypothetical protein [Pyrinomonadaceae bacterium]